MQNEDVKRQYEQCNTNLYHTFWRSKRDYLSKFSFDYPDNWMISQEEVTQTNEKVILTNERGVTVHFSYIGGVAEGNLGVGSATDMLRVEVSKAAGFQLFA